MKRNELARLTEPPARKPEVTPQAIKLLYQEARAVTTGEEVPV